ncbi:MAG: hypothetical protein J6Z14_08270 [Prevotella sp.]|nr:hypothetical protein [Prevotella sp.]
MTQRLKNWLFLSAAMLFMASGAQADEGLTVYGRDGSIYSCTFAQLPVITFSQTGLKIEPKSGAAMAEKAYSSVSKIDFNVRNRADVNGDGRVDIADIISVINTNAGGTNAKPDVNRDGKVDKADVKLIIDEFAR